MDSRRTLKDWVSGLLVSNGGRASLLGMPNGTHQARKEVRQRGAALIETALVLPMLLMLTFGIWTAARAWNVRNTMEHAAREGVRFAATELPWDGTSQSQVEAVIDAELVTSAIPIANVNTLCIDRATNPCGFNPTSQGYQQVAVRIQYPNYPLNFLFFQPTVNLTVEAVGRYEG
jgi:Flp pilus assembly protein TadG